MCLTILPSKNVCGHSMCGILVCLSSARHLFAIFGGQIIVFLWVLFVSCSDCAVLFSVASRGVFPLRLSSFPFLSSLSLGGRLGRGFLSLAPLPCLVRSSTRQAHAAPLCSPSFPPLLFPSVLPPLPPHRGRPPLLPAVSLSVLFFMFFFSFSLSFIFSKKSLFLFLFLFFIFSFFHLFLFLSFFKASLLGWDWDSYWHVAWGFWVCVFVSFLSFSLVFFFSLASLSLSLSLFCSFSLSLSIAPVQIRGDE